MKIIKTTRDIFGTALGLILPMVGNLCASELHLDKKYTSIRIQSAEEILLPVDGYFDLDEYWFYDIQADAPKPLGHYKSWSPKPEMLPTFGTLSSRTFSQETRTALIFNQRCFKKLLEKRATDEFSGSWSASEKRKLRDFGLFGVPNSSRWNIEEGKSQPKFDLLGYFEGNKDFVSRITTLDLTFLRLDVSGYKAISGLKNLEQIALPLDGSVWNDEDFIANANVRELVIWNTAFSRKSLSKLSEFSGLERLVLNGCILNYTPGPRSEGIKSETEVGTYDPLMPLRGRLKALTMIDCDDALVQIIGADQWKSVTKFEGDTVPSNFETSFSAVRFLTLYVDETQVKNFTQGRASPYGWLGRWSSPNVPIFDWNGKD